MRDGRKLLNLKRILNSLLVLYLRHLNTPFFKSTNLSAPSQCEICGKPTIRNYLQLVVEGIHCTYVGI